MITENLSTLKIHKLTQEQYDRALAEGSLDNNAIYLTPDNKSSTGGYTPVRGTDYWTDADKAEIKSYVDDAILNGAW
jgi:hypothetical protein